MTLKVPLLVQYDTYEYSNQRACIRPISYVQANLLIYGTNLVYGTKVGQNG